METEYDVIIIGSGAGGGTLAHSLASSGKRVLVLERGGFIPKEKENWDPREIFSNGRYRTTERWFDGDGNAFIPNAYYNVGGNTKMYGAALFRLRKSDFEETLHFGGLSPAWPIRYEDLEPFYTLAEQMYSVHGERGADPTEPPAAYPYPYRALPMEDSMVELYRSISDLGYRPFPIPLGIRNGGSLHQGFSPVVLANFDGFPDPTETKADAHVTCVREALTHPNVKLFTNAMVKRLITNRSGNEITGVVVSHPEGDFAFKAHIVCLAAGAVNSAAILLRSATNDLPQGLANRSGMVGRNYMLHQNGCVINISEKRNTAKFQKAFSLSDFYHKSSDYDYPLGTIQLMGKNDPDTVMSLAGSHFPNASFEEISERSIDFWITSEDLPDTNNRVSVNNNGDIVTSYKVNNRKAYTELKQKLFQMLDRLSVSEPLFRNAVRVGYDLGISGTSHQMGTLRFGSDPAQSVLDLNCKAHDVDNLYAVDASFFPSSGAYNPSLTIMANALRVGEHIKARLGI